MQLLSTRTAFIDAKPGCRGLIEMSNLDIIADRHETSRRVPFRRKGHAVFVTVATFQGA